MMAAKPRKIIIENLLMCLSILTPISCHLKQDPPLLLKGDWMLSQPESLGFGFAFGVSFDNDTVLIIRNGWYDILGPYQQVGDSILIEEAYNQHEKIVWKVLANDPDSLVLLQAGRRLTYYARDLEYVDSLQLEQISVEAFGCLGECPVFDLNYIAPKMIEFDPIQFCKANLSTRYSLDDSTKNRLDQSFKRSWIHHLDTTTVLSDVDDWAFRYKFTFNGGQHISFTCTQFNVPFRIKPIHGTILRDLKNRGLIR